MTFQAKKTYYDPWARQSCMPLVWLKELFLLQLFFQTS